MQRKALIAIALLLLALPLAAAFRTISVPAGTSIKVRIDRTISTATAKVGQSVPGELAAPLVINGRTIAKEGSRVMGRITEAEASGRVGGSAKLTWTLSSITLANGNRVEVRTSSYSREGKAHAKHNATYIVGGALAGAAIGQLAGGNRDATRKGTAIGAGVGLGAAAATGKFDFELKAGSTYILKLRRSFNVAI